MTKPVKDVPAAVRRRLKRHRQKDKPAVPGIAPPCQTLYALCSTPETMMPEPANTKSPLAIGPRLASFARLRRWRSGHLEPPRVERHGDPPGVLGRAALLVGDLRLAAPEGGGQAEVFVDRVVAQVAGRERHRLVKVIEARTRPGVVPRRPGPGRVRVPDRGRLGRQEAADHGGGRPGPVRHRRVVRSRSGRPRTEMSLAVSPHLTA